MEQEVRKWERRAVAEIEELAKADDALNDASRWTADVRVAMEHQKPAVTHAQVDAINNAHLSWTAQDTEEMEDVSAADVQNLCGIEPTEEALIQFEEYEQRRLESGIEQETYTEGLNAEGEFMASENWPACASTINHVRDQGNCGSCWAMAVAGVMDARLCIKGPEGAWNGPASWISAGYIASCANGGNDGCRGGWPEDALKWVARHGAPTGSNGSNWQACAPYKGGSSSPSCPTQCYSERPGRRAAYPRSLQQ